MGRARIKNRHLPRWMHHKHGAYYFVRAGKWLRLSNEYGPALIEYSKLVGDSPRVTTVEHASDSFDDSEIPFATNRGIY